TGLAELGGRGAFDAGRVAGSFDAGHLHSKANSEERDFPLASEPDAGDLALASALAEPAGYEDSVEWLELGGELAVVTLEQLGIEPADIDLDPVGDAAMHQCLA